MAGLRYPIRRPVESEPGKWESFEVKTGSGRFEEYRLGRSGRRRKLLLRSRARLNRVAANQHACETSSMPTTLRRARRTRFTATMADGTRKVFLGYNRQGVIDYYTERGYTVAKVEYGDYRRHEEARKAAQGCEYVIDVTRVQAAAVLLGITWTLEIGQRGHAGSQHGAYMLTPIVGEFKRDAVYDTASGGFKHVISIKTYLTVEQANETLWHELAHAAQTERLAAALHKQNGSYTMRELFDAWRYYDYGVGYKHKSRERDANAVADRHAAGYPLVTAR